MFRIIKNLKPIDYANITGCIIMSVATVHYVNDDAKKTNEIIREKKKIQNK